jgi:hypothetical protein
MPRRDAARFDSAIDAGCANDGDCPAGLRCAGGRCTDAFCGAGASCLESTECCGLFCQFRSCGGAEICARLGESCAFHTECCSRNCSGGTCADNPTSVCTSAGESCATADVCCSDRCTDASGAPCAGGECRCARSSYCQPRGELCAGDAECCSGTCRKSAHQTVGTCDASPTCLADGEPCAAPGDVCCSGQCAADEGSGTPICRCASVTLRLPAQDCRVGCDLCSIDIPRIACQLGSSGTNICCLGDGVECALDELCCSGMCAQDGRCVPPEG